MIQYVDLADDDMWLSLMLPFTCGQRVMIIQLEWMNDSLLKEIKTPAHKVGTGMDGQNW